MHPRWKLAVALFAAVPIVALAGPADADTIGNTPTSFATSGGALAITVPASAYLGSAGPGGSSTAQLGAVQVVDTRALAVGTWTATVSATNFTTGGASAAETVPKASLSYWSGAATASTGLGTSSPGQLGAANAQDLSVSRTAYAKLSGSGNSSVTWNPTLIVSRPAASVVGTYAGTVTHSVA